jgi:type I restriction enzyme, S subunit
MPVSLPPLEEQKRIVTKVGQLMKLCDTLETQLNQSQETSERLIESVVKELAA